MWIRLRVATFGSICSLPSWHGMSCSPRESCNKSYHAVFLLWSIMLSNGGGGMISKPIIMLCWFFSSYFFHAGFTLTYRFWIPSLNSNSFSYSFCDYMFCPLDTVFSSYNNSAKSFFNDPSLYHFFNDTIKTVSLIKLLHCQHLSYSKILWSWP